MISNIDSNYNAICKLFNFSKESSADINKKILLEMAKNGEPKPKVSTKLGSAFSTYTRKSYYYTFDPIFTKQIRKLRPDWFISQTQITNQNKKELINMAKNNEKRPSQKTRIGRLLSNYTSKLSGSYDPIFTKKIKKLRPDWFVSQTQIANQNKKELINMAKNNKKRPSQKTRIGQALSNYTHKSSSTYDLIFDKQIRNLRPDWFDSSNLMKQILIRMAKDGKPRPKQKTKEGKEGRALTRYTTKGASYDKSFDKQIRKLRPDWFVTVSEKANEKKLELIRIAKNGENRPKKKTKLGRCFVNYIFKTSDTYDPVFDKKIRKLRPDWFKNPTPLPIN